MAGVYDQGWGYSVVVALGVVLAAMYTLRVISAILHVKPGRAVREEALDLRPASSRSSSRCSSSSSGSRSGPRSSARARSRGDARPRSLKETSRDRRDRHADTSTGSRSRRRSRCSPPRAWRSSPRCCPTGCARASPRLRPSRASSPRPASRSTSSTRAQTPEVLLDGSMTRDQLAAVAQAILGVHRAQVVLASWGERRRDESRRVLRPARNRRRRDGVLRERRQPHDALPRPRVVLALPLHPRRHRHRARDVARGGPKYLIVGGFGSAVLLFGSALVYGATCELSFGAIGSRSRRATPSSSPASR